MERIKSFLIAEEIDPAVVGYNPDEGTECNQLFYKGDLFFLHEKNVLISVFKNI